MRCGIGRHGEPWLWARSDRSFSLRSLAFSRSRGSAGGRPTGAANASRAPRSRCFCHAAINEEYNPSRRSNAPFAAFPRPSYSARILALYAAVYVRDLGLAGTSGSGTCSAVVLIRG